MADRSILISNMANTGALNLLNRLLMVWKIQCQIYQIVLCLQCFDAVGWAAGRASDL